MLDSLSSKRDDAASLARPETRGMEKLGTRFWLWFVGIGAALVVGTVLVFLLLHATWARWGALGTLIFFFVVIGGVAWFYDRRQVKKYEDLPA
jgi:Flp pilus assembly protein TadB